MARKAVSIKEVALRAGVSVGTVSNVLNRPDSVAEPTRLAVVAAIDELGFVRNGSASRLRSTRSHVVGLVVHDIGNPFFAEVARGAEQALELRGYSVMLCNSAATPERQQRHLHFLEEQRVAGVLLTPVDPSRSPSGARATAPLDQLGQVEPLAREGVGALTADRADDVRRCAAADQRGERILGGVVVDELDLEEDLVLIRVVLVDQCLLLGDLLFLGAGAEADEPGDGRAVARTAASRVAAAGGGLLAAGVATAGVTAGLGGLLAAAGVATAAGLLRAGPGVVVATTGGGHERQADGDGAETTHRSLVA